MAEADKQNFWTTIPGILTGLAAVLTAASGFWLAVHNRAAEASDPANHAPIVTADSRPAPDAPVATTATNPLSPPAPVPATANAGKQGSVTLRSRAGDTTQLSLKSFKHNMTEDTIQLTSGQTIAFEKIHQLDYLTVDGDAHTIGLKLTLTDGRVVDGTIASNYAYKGESDLGPFTIFVQDVKQIVFNR
ncbi:hypothetical protein Terro_4050 [Terriglobus roseus DSM 18391]|uniref:Uncharacterized protein n=1 Tax=Terriglobus roseus (strain DSM 18391 / NRRL B-41598 / KBS 63) TaxID=926566 RepID=I3ZLY9_TERRK|nr:hypothetical protein [Terriglobus roseus]AFL90257.1 hypothetical protein Terro_4050 [Terriglobus roseus DSM 18391]